MPTKVFISWSGLLSQRLGECLRNWLPSALQFVKPYFSPEDIEKGTKWDLEISQELKESNIGIICLTRDNTDKPWICFEAGALSKSLEKSRVYILLFGVDPSDIKGPLTNFQATKFSRDDFKKLFCSINNSAGESSLEPAVLDNVFDMWWPKLEEEISIILKSSDNIPKTTPRRTERDILEELLELTRMNSSRSIQQDIPTRAIVRLMESLEALPSVLPLEISETVLRLIEKPLHDICIEAGIHELYDSLFRRVRRFSNPSNRLRSFPLMQSGERQERRYPSDLSKDQP